MRRASSYRPRACTVTTMPPRLNSVVVVAGLVLRNAGPGQRADDAAAGRADGRAAERCRDRPGRDDRSDAWDRQSADADQPAGHAAEQTACQGAGRGTGGCLSSVSSASCRQCRGLEPGC